jgi:hypothetical protein
MIGALLQMEDDMRKLAVLGALLLTISLAGPADAIIPGDTTFTVFTQVRGHGYIGSISITKRVDNTSARLEVDISGMHANQLATVEARSGSCAHDRSLIVRVRRFSTFRNGHWTGRYALTSSMLAHWNAALRSGNVHFTFTQGGVKLCGNGIAV